MKQPLLIFLLLFSFLTASQAQYLMERRVSLDVEGLSLEQALYQLADANDIQLSFSNDILPDRRVSMHVDGVSLKVVLAQLLQHSALKFQEVGNQAVIFLPPDTNFTISGFLEDARTGERLAGANVVELNTGRGTASNEYGFYSLTLPAGRVVLSYSYLGYEPRVKEYVLNESIRASYALRPSLTLEPVEVVAPRVGGVTGTPAPGTGQEIDVYELEHLPTLGGESDIIRLSHLLPGVQTGTDGVGGLHIRGGDNGQNLIMIDGVPVYNISHAAGLFSVFNSQAIRSARLIKGGFPARYGGRLSSVLDIRTREGNSKEFSVRADVGMLSGRFLAEGPIVRGKSSFFVSGRRSLADWYLQPLTRGLKEEKGEDGFIGYRFYDLNAKLNYELSGNDHLYLSYYSGSDRYTNQGQASDTLSVGETTQPEPSVYRFDRKYDDAVRWGNTVASLRWNHLFNDKLFANLALTYSSLDVDIRYFSADSLVQLNTGQTVNRLFDLGHYSSDIRDIGGRLDFDFMAIPGHYIRFGANLAHHDYLPGLLAGTGEKSGNGEIDSLPPITESNPRATAMEYSVYVEDEFRLGSRLSFNAGLHAAVFATPGKAYPSLQPRLLATWQLSKRLSLEGYYSLMQQPVHLLSNSAIGLPTELWVPSTDKVGPQEGWQSGLSADWAFRQGWSLETDGYYKSMDNLLAYSEGALFLNDWEDNVTAGNGTAYGMEMLLRKSGGKLRGWAGYSLAWADRQYAQVNNGQPYPYKFGRRHEFKMALMYRIHDWVNLSANWVYSTGFAFSPPLGQYEVVIPGVGTVQAVDFGNKNAYRMPPYHRLDVGANFYFETDSRLRHTINVGVYNLYNRRNPLYYDLRSKYVEENGKAKAQKEFVQVWLIPMLPSLNYSIQF
ncbi:MAG: TonB-dependent receptor [Lewinellaceae bacterium]|nr:TonB-dependent receptor [Lewinellaceae bacterium]